MSTRRPIALVTGGSRGVADDCPATRAAADESAVRVCHERPHDVRESAAQLTLVREHEFRKAFEAEIISRHVGQCLGSAPARFAMTPVNPR
jgi:hypothetical protein